jgi:hypothetical protein
MQGLRVEAFMQVSRESLHQKYSPEGEGVCVVIETLEQQELRKLVLDRVLDEIAGVKGRLL